MLARNLMVTRMRSTGLSVGAEASSWRKMTARYHYLTEWSDEDGIFVGYCYEFPSLVAYGDNHNSAKAAIMRVVAKVVTGLKENGLSVPEQTIEPGDTCPACNGPVRGRHVRWISHESGCDLDSDPSFTARARAEWDALQAVLKPTLCGDES